MPTETSNTPPVAGEAPIIGPGYTFASVTDKISSIVLGKKTDAPLAAGIRARFILVQVLFFTIAYLLIRGVGIWGINIPVGWGFAIVNFVWWIGIGHAGTLISAILLLLQAEVADVDQSLRRGDDALRGLVRRAYFRCCTWAGRGSSTGCCPIPTPCSSGRNFAAR